MSAAFSAVRRNRECRRRFAYGPGQAIRALCGQFLFQAELLDDGIRDCVAKEFVEVHPREPRLLFGRLDVADVLVQLDVIALLGVGQRSDGGLILDFLLNDLLLQFGGVEFDQHLVGLHVVLGDLVAFFHDLQDFGALITDADLAFDLLRFERLNAAAFEHGDGQRAAAGDKGRAGAGGFAALFEPNPSQGEDENDPGNAPTRLSFDEPEDIIRVWH